MTDHSSKRVSEKGQVRLGVLAIAGVVLLIFLCAYFWIWRGRGEPENVVYSFINNSHVVDDVIDAVTETELVFGDPTAASFLISGFTKRVEMTDGLPTLWAEGKASAVRFTVKQLSDKLVSLRCTPYVYDFMKPQTLTIRVNQKFFKEIELAPAWWDYDFVIPASLLQLDENRLDFSYTQATVPAEVIGNEDTRALSVNFSSLIIKHPSTRKTVSVQRWDVQGQSKPVLAVRPNESLSFCLEVPPAARLRFDFGIQPNAFPKITHVNYKVFLQLDDDSDAQVLADKTLEGATLQPIWLSEEVDIARFARKLVRITFKVATLDPAGSKQIAWAGWGNPRLVADKRDAAADTVKPVSLPVPREKYNVLLIFLDGLQADHTTNLGYYRPTTSKIDALARESIHFSQAISPANRALPAHVSVFTGLYPYMHGIRSADQIPARAPSFHWLEALKAQGNNYVAQAFVEDPDLDAYYKSIGFSTTLAQAGTAPGEDANPSLERLTTSLTAAKAWLYANAQERFFMVYQTSFLLPPFSPPVPYGQMFYPEYYSNRDRKLGYHVNEKMLERIHSKELQLDDPDIQQLRALYDGELRYLDLHIDGLIQQMNELGLGKNTIVILTSAHGLQLGEHGLVATLGQTVYDEEVHVPLIIRFPDSVKLSASLINQQVRLIDIMPTVMHVLGMPVTPRVSGVSLAPLFKGQPLDLIAISEAMATPMISLRTNEWKLLGRAGKSWVENPNLFNLRFDPDESDNYTKRRPVMADFLRQDLDGRLAQPAKTY